MEKIISFVVENQAAILGALVAAAGLGVAISRFTKTDKDDKFFSRLLGILKGKQPPTE